MDPCSEVHIDGCVLCSDEEIDPEAGECEQNVALKWTAEAGSSIYATPLITDLYSDGSKDVILPSFVHQLRQLQSVHNPKTPSSVPRKLWTRANLAARRKVLRMLMSSID